MHQKINKTNQVIARLQLVGFVAELVAVSISKNTTTYEVHHVDFKDPSQPIIKHHCADLKDAIYIYKEVCSSALDMYFDSLL